MLTIRSGNPSWAFTLEKYSQETYKNVCSSLVYNSTKAETSQMFFSGWMDKQTSLTWLAMGKHNKLNFKGITLKERIKSQGVTYSAILFAWHAQKHGTIMTQKRSVSLGLRAKLQQRNSKMEHFLDNKFFLSWTYWCTPVTSDLRSLRLNNHESECSLGCIMRHCIKKRKGEKKGKW